MAVKSFAGQRRNEKDTVDRLPDTGFCRDKTVEAECPDIGETMLQL